MHSHDVRALASWPSYTPLPHALQCTFPLDLIPILANGGLDMSVVLAPAALPASTVVRAVNPLETSVESTLGDAYHRRLGFPRQGAVRVAREARLILCVREASLTVWRVKERFNWRSIQWPL
jgi:U3 small nucleolar RNA-associated protein 4